MASKDLLINWCGKWCDIWCASSVKASTQAGVLSCFVCCNVMLLQLLWIWCANLSTTCIATDNATRIPTGPAAGVP